MKNICIFISTLLNGGAEKQAVLLAKVLSRENKVWVVVYYPNLAEQKFLDVIGSEKINIIYLNGNQLIRIFKLFRFLRNESIDIIFSFLLNENIIGGIIGKMVGVKFRIGGVRVAFNPKMKVFYQKLSQNYINNFTIYNNYRGVKELAKIGFNQDKSIVIPNCLELNVKPILRKKKDLVRIISVGRFVAQKDYLTAIKSISMLKKWGASFEYIIIGWGILENDIKKWLSEYEIDDVTEIIINPLDLDEYYKNSDIYIQTSLYEGLSNTVLEAMSYSLPLVITDVGDNERLIRNNGFLCNIGDTEQLYLGLVELTKSHKLRVEYGKNSYQLVKKNYSIEKFTSRYIEFIEMLDG